MSWTALLVVRFIQAERLSAPVSWRLVPLPGLMKSLVPLNDLPLPNFPATTVVPVTVPVLLSPEESVALVAAVNSSTFHQPTKPLLRADVPAPTTALAPFTVPLALLLAFV